MPLPLDDALPREVAFPHVLEPRAVHCGHAEGLQHGDLLSCTGPPDKSAGIYERCSHVRPIMMGCGIFQHERSGQEDIFFFTGSPSCCFFEGGGLIGNIIVNAL